MSEVRTKTIGTIIKFDPETQFAEVRLACNGTSSTLDQNYFNVEAAVLIDVPVEFPRCGGFVQTFPVKPGDDCIVEFFEQGITHWLYDNRRTYKVEKGRPEAAARRKFSTSDAVCRVVIGNLAKTVPGFSSDSWEIRNWEGGQRITFSPNGDISISTTKSINLQAERIVMRADEVDINGAVTDAEGGCMSPKQFAAPSLLVGGKEMSDHTHGGVTRGNSQTDPNT